MSPHSHSLRNFNITFRTCVMTYGNPSWAKFIKVNLGMIAWLNTIKQVKELYECK